MSSLGTQDGDVQILDGGTWKWINDDDGQLVTTRPANPVQDEFWSKDVSENTDSTDPFVWTGNLISVVTIPASPSGIYIGTLSFNVADTFFFDDVNNDGNFDPGSGDQEAGINGKPLWWPEAPVITAAFTQE